MAKLARVTSPTRDGGLHVSDCWERRRRGWEGRGGKHRKVGALAHNIFLMSTSHGSRSIRTPHFSIVPLNNLCPRHLHTIFTTLLTPPQQPARPPSHQPGHGRQSHNLKKRILECDEHDGRTAVSSPFAPTRGLEVKNRIEAAMKRASPWLARL